MGWILLNDGCCLQWVEVEPYILKGSYINEESTFNPLIDPYLPYINETNPDLFYVQENYNMAEPIPHKHSEDAIAPSFNAMSIFSGLQDNGDGTYTNYQFTPAQLIGFVAPMLRLPYQVETTGETITVPDINGKTVQAITIPNGSLTKSQFTQVNNDITYTGNSFYENDEILFTF